MNIHAAKECRRETRRILRRFGTVELTRSKKHKRLILVQLFQLATQPRHHACTVVRCKDVAKGAVTSGGSADQCNDAKVHHRAAAGPSTQNLAQSVTP